MKKFIFACLCTLSSLSGWGWSQKGHDATAYIAEQHLTPAALDSVSNLFDGKSIVYWANWLDNASHTPPYAYTKTWHYKNIDAGVPYEKAKINPNGDVVTAIREQISILQNPVSNRDQKVLALKILVHCVGDLHQPMHIGHASDLGGNKVKVRFFDRDTNLHSIWDGSIMNSGHAWSYTEWQQQLDRLTPEQQKAITQGNIDDWAKETYQIAGRVYDYFPEGKKVSYNEIAAWTPIIEQQILAGGLRLAEILNAIFTPQLRPASDF